ncbi:unnamed protein product [Trichobilharzia regenti]|nr:unnamed protein product [Trichobilharzia regenti]
MRGKFRKSSTKSVIGQNDNIKEEKPHNITGNAEKPDKEVKVGKEEKEEKKDKEDKKEKEDKKGKKEDGKEGDKDGGDGDDDDDDDDDDDEDEEEKKPRRGIFLTQIDSQISWSSGTKLRPMMLITKGSKITNLKTLGIFMTLVVMD